MISKLMFKNTFLFSFILLFSCGNSVKSIEEREKVIDKDIAPKEIPIQELKTGADNFEKYTKNGWRIILP